MIKHARDGRRQPQIPSSVIFTVLLAGFALRTPSMEDLERQLRKGRFQKLLPRHARVPSHDTIRYALRQWDLETLTQSHDQMIAKYKRNRGPQKGTLDGWRVVAVDGVELFNNTCHSCKDCLTRFHKTTGVTEYFHRAVMMQQVGADPHMIYGLEMLRPGDGADKAEGETTAAQRLIRETIRRHGRLADIAVFDALYAKASVIHDCLDHAMDVVIRMKEERRLIMQDAKGLFDTRPADCEWVEQRNGKNLVRVKAWDEPGLASWPQVRIPMRMVKAVYTAEKTVVQGGKRQQVTEITERWMATTCDPNAVPAKTVARIMAARWDIENTGFHDLKTYWHMDHAYVHEPTAIRAWLGILVITVNLFYTFVYGHLHHFREWKIPLTEVVEEMKEQMRWLSANLARLLWVGD
ncbi:hypothetical protein ATW55_06270 [Ferroacidibacillus organovorans]|uniref:Transposase IS4-like domain-containing protein n=3 Tax=Ferroacidibacillus organovorans TaxID=1765683 RepID=A0A101XTV9_9BACL|nr:hypothetical protein ATW55_06145 [Ferroacidibacillus organovorans]KUO97463.1 hypothetical protein ATW55_06270 [Ferroacidibacillus organovorans]